MITARYPLPLHRRSVADLSTALKNANDMLKDVVKAMDKNGDQVIQYEGMVSGVLFLHISSSFQLNTGR